MLMYIFGTNHCLTGESLLQCIHLLFFIIAVRPSHINFQTILKKVLKENVKVVDSGVLKVDDLLHRLQSCQEIQFLETDRRNLLHEVSMVFGKHISYRGKKRE